MSRTKIFAIVCGMLAIVAVTLTGRLGIGATKRAAGPKLAHMVYFKLKDGSGGNRAKLVASCKLLLSGHDDSDGNFRYAPDKWSVKEVLGHVCDTERIFAYRALRISRGDRNPIEGFEQDDYVRNGPFANRPLAELIEEYIAVRRATLTLLRNLDETAWTRRGIANNNEVSVRAIAYTIAGHEIHHRRILEGKYFSRT